MNLADSPDALMPQVTSDVPFGNIKSKSLKQNFINGPDEATIYDDVMLTQRVVNIRAT